jgi:predicted RNA-binding Zn-ribbon protein involved in translation (DUF1610 family)
MAEWIQYEDPNFNAWECPSCGAVQYLESGTPLENEWFYCPHCGEPLGTKAEGGEMND